MKTWIKIRPVDTFFFKGSTPMVMGENHTSEFIFPPHAATLAGAVRTAVLRQNNVDFKEYALESFDDAKIISTIGKAGNTPPFDILGPFFSKQDKYFIPAPYSWYMEKDDKLKTTAIQVYKSRPVKSSHVVTSSRSKLYIAKGRKGELATIGSRWIEQNDLYSKEKKIRVKPLSDFFENEPRTGIALSKNRKVRESHLYTFNHIRLNSDVELVFGINSSKQLPLPSSGILQLGGEKRLGHYKTIEMDVNDNNDETGFHMTLSSLPCEGIDENMIVATGKIQYISGWDMKKGFHKPSCACYPPGSVFTEKTDTNQISIKEENNYA